MTTTYICGQEESSILGIYVLWDSLVVRTLYFLQECEHMSSANKIAK